MSRLPMTTGVGNFCEPTDNSSTVLKWKPFQMNSKESRKYTETSR